MNKQPCIPLLGSFERAPGLDPRQEERWYRDRRWRRDRAIFQAMTQARGTGVQLDVLGDILFHIEQVFPGDFPNAEALRAFLVHLGEHVTLPDAAADPDIVREAEQERFLFSQYIQRLPAETLKTIPVLPYRHVLDYNEQEQIWHRLEHTWGLTPHLHWYPLKNIVPPPHVIALQEDWFAREVPLDALREILQEHGVSHVWELRELGSFIQYEMDVSMLIPWDGGGEHCWTSQLMDWILYTSHEHSVTLGGEWFLNAIKRIWPQWEEHLYTNYRYERPPLDPL